MPIAQRYNYFSYRFPASIKNHSLTRPLVSRGTEVSRFRHPSKARLVVEPFSDCVTGCVGALIAFDDGDGFQGDASTRAVGICHHIGALRNQKNLVIGALLADSVTSAAQGLENILWLSEQRGG